MRLANDEFELLYDDIESDRVERKASFSHPDQVREAICAFSNDLPGHRLPGVIILGQNNDRSCANLLIDDRLLLQLAGIRNEGLILPLPMMQVERRVVQGCEIAAITVEPSDRPPVRFNGRTSIRVGPRRAVATIDEERRLTERQLWRNLPFDSRPFAGSTIDDLDLIRFENEYIPAAFSRRVIEENGRSTTEKLRALRLVSPEAVPTSAALLLFGKNPRAFLPGAYIQFIRIGGTALTDTILDQKELAGTVSDVTSQIDALIRINSRTSATISGGLRAEVDDYPFSALEQLLRNAILHRNYDGSHSPVKFYWFDDRVEIHNPGGLFGEVTPETIWMGATSYRNPLLAEGMKSLGLVERFGFGLIKAKSALSDNDNPPLKAEFVETFIAFILERRP